MSVELAQVADKLKDAFEKLGVLFKEISWPERRGLTRYQTLQMCGLMIDLRAEYGFMCWELAFAIEQAILTYGTRARGKVWWVFACEWDCDIEGWRDGYEPYLVPNTYGP